MAGINGKIPSLPEGAHAISNQIYISRVRVGYGDSGRTAGGGSDGCHRWIDTAGEVPLLTIPATSSGASTLEKRGYIIHNVWHYVLTAWAGATACTIGDCGNAAGFIASSELSPGSTGGSTYPSSVFTKPPYMKGYPRIYRSSDADRIEATFTGDATAGIMDVYVAWSYAEVGQLGNTDWPNT